MTELAERIQKALQHKALSWSGAAVKLGFSAQAATNWKKGKISRDTLSGLAELTGVSKAWLLDGTGAMLIDGVPVESVKMTPVEDWDSKTPLDDDEVEIPFYKDFAMACGTGSTHDSDYLEWRKLRFSKLTLKKEGIEKANAVAVTATGDSMLPIISDGSTVFINKGDTVIKDGRIYAIDHGGLHKVKYLYNLPKGGVRIVSANSEEFPEERLTAEDIINQEFRVCGRIFSMSIVFPR